MPVKKKPGAAVSQVPMTDDMNVIQQRYVTDLGNFAASQFYVLEDEHGEVKQEDPVRVEQDPVKGRVLIALRDFQPGDIIFRERAFVAASWNEFHCIECMKPHKPTQCDAVRQRYPKVMIENLRTIENQLADMEEIGEIDRARCLIKAIGLVNANPESPVVHDFLRLTTVRPYEAYECITQLAARKLIKNAKVFPPGFDLVKAAQILSILNCNSHEIENIGGSGVFLQASMMEHNCLPNCNFVTQDRDIFVVCIRPIKAGDNLSIDYAQTFYYPTAMRKAALAKSHDFICQCDQCTILPDRCRAFNCPQAIRNREAGVQPLPGAPITPQNCLDGVVCPIAEGNELKDWKCLNCGYQLTQEELNICLEAEARYPPPPEDDEYEKDPDVESIYEEVKSKEERAKQGRGGYSDSEDDDSGRFHRDVAAIDAILAEGVLHETHFTIFHSLLREGYALAKLASVEVSSETTVSTASRNKNNRNKRSKEDEDAEDEEFLRQFSEGKFTAEHLTGRLKIDKRKKIKAWQRAAHVWRRIIKCAESVLPQYHPDKTNFLDSLAQVLVAGKDIAGAQKVWKQAWELSCIVAGRETKQTLQLKRLYKKTPHSVEELMFHYDNVHNILDQIEYEDDEASRKLIEGLAASSLQADEDPELNLDGVSDVESSESDYYVDSDEEADDDDEDDADEETKDIDDEDDDGMTTAKVSKKQADLLFGMQSELLAKQSPLISLTGKLGGSSATTTKGKDTGKSKTASSTGSGWGKQAKPVVLKTGSHLQITLPKTSKQGLFSGSSKDEFKKF